MDSWTSIEHELDTLETAEAEVERAGTECTEEAIHTVSTLHHKIVNYVHELEALVGGVRPPATTGKRLLRAANIDGPWEVLWDADRVGDGEYHSYPLGITPFPGMLDDEYEYGIERAELICWLVNHAPSLIGAVRKVEKAHDILWRLRATRKKAIPALDRAIAVLTR